MLNHSTSDLEVNMKEIRKWLESPNPFQASGLIWTARSANTISGHGLIFLVIYPISNKIGCHCQINQGNYKPTFAAGR
jgi:hypothetical protein